MPEPVVLALIGTAGTIITAYIGARAKRWVDRRAAERAEIRSELQQRQADREQWESLVNQWRTEVHDLRDMRAEDKRVYEAEVRELRVRVEQLERDREADRERIQRLTNDLLRLSEWARRVVQLLRTNNITFPQLPIDIGDSGEA